MACFIVPVAEAVISTVAARILETKEKKSDESQKASDTDFSLKICFSKKVRWLSKLLWGGSFLLAFEHLWHCEIKPFFPFLTAAEHSESFSVMLHEMSTVGVSMSLTVTAAWIGMLIVSGIFEKRPKTQETREMI